MSGQEEAYGLKVGEGWIYRYPEAEFHVKSRESGPGRFAVVEYTATEDEWPGHTHKTEDEAFYVLDGSVTFRCGDREFDLDGGGFVRLPCGIQHGYKLRNGKPARLLVITAPVAEPGSAQGWSGFIADIEADLAARVATPRGLD